MCYNIITPVSGSQPSEKPHRASAVFSRRHYYYRRRKCKYARTRANREISVPDVFSIRYFRHWIIGGVCVKCKFFPHVFAKRPRTIVLPKRFRCDDVFRQYIFEIMFVFSSYGGVGVCNLYDVIQTCDSRVFGFFFGLTYLVGVSEFYHAVVLAIRESRSNVCCPRFGTRSSCCLLIIVTIISVRNGLYFQSACFANFFQSLTVVNRDTQALRTPKSHHLGSLFTSREAFLVYNTPRSGFGLK